VVRKRRKNKILRINMEVIMKDKFIKICNKATFDYNRFYIASNKIDKIDKILFGYNIDCMKHNYLKIMMALRDLTIYIIKDRIQELRDKYNKEEPTRKEMNELQKLDDTAISMDIFKRIYNKDISVYDDIAKHNYLGLAAAKETDLFDLTVFTILLASGIIDEIPEKIVNRFNAWVDKGNRKCGHICMEDFKILVEEK
jgi:hypothetical protein